MVTVWPLPGLLVITGSPARPVMTAPPRSRVRGLSMVTEVVKSPPVQLTVPPGSVWSIRSCRAEFFSHTAVSTRLVSGMGAVKS